MKNSTAAKPQQDKRHWAAAAIPDIPHQEQGLQVGHQIARRNDVGKAPDGQGHGGDLKNKAGQQKGRQKAGDHGDLGRDKLVFGQGGDQEPLAQGGQQKGHRGEEQGAHGDRGRAP